ncbi:MAG: hypothetical protein AAFN93_22620 [Bacteroidota bacterium]
MIPIGLHKIIKRTTGNGHYLMVYKLNGKTFYKIDGAGPQQIDQQGIDLRDYEYIEKVVGDTVVNNLIFTMRWTDDQDTVFERRFRNVHVLREIFKEMPSLAKAAGANLRPGKRYN